MLRTWSGVPVEIWFQDEARVGQKGSLSYIWAKKGSCPVMVRDNRHDTAYLFGAICPARAVGAAVITPAVNTECMNLHLAEISTQVAPGAMAAVICDGAGWHKAGGALRVPGNLLLIPLHPIRPSSTRWRMSGSTCAPTGSRSGCGRITMLSSRHAPARGTGSWGSQGVFGPSGPGTGQRSVVRAVGITRNSRRISR